ncbi:glycosyltransferase family 2 protein [Alteromonas sp. LMIT006]|uniref:glycosyltransferase family A protein n=1 Tax=Alteromonadaceae TaxID=72275 RepID=UPI0020CA93BE|nr:glycosyltransferase family A protein [Alteromonas sp. LMIT006]UTP71585.1 glycosyltransferase family 2 protein [Alteromonas sp. LMIT006]
MSYAICMFAYNEEKHIETSLSSVFSNIDSECKNVTLMANGCTDQTVSIAQQMANTNNLLNVIELSLGDKCNAWNTYIHENAPDVDTHFFIDADVKFTSNVFPILHEQLQNSSAHAVAGVPASGRNKAYYESLVTDRSCFFGNLYGLSNNFIQMIKKKSFYMPVGLNWIDSFLTKAVNTDIQFLDYNLPNRVTYKLGHGYEFDSLSPFKFDDIKLYKNRIARYELGKLQEVILDSIPVKRWPRDMHEINLQIHAQNMVKNVSQPIKRLLVKQRLEKLLSSGPKIVMDDSVCVE